jgi:hypothetical protein
MRQFAVRFFLNKLGCCSKLDIFDVKTLAQSDRPKTRRIVLCLRAVNFRMLLARQMVWQVYPGHAHPFSDVTGVPGCLKGMPENRMPKVLS